MTPAFSPTPDPARQLLGVPFEEIAVLSPRTRLRVRAIYERGKTLGRNPQAFSKLGDSAVLTDHNLTRFDTGPYNLGPYVALQPTIDYFSGSFVRYGAGARVSLTTIGVFDPQWANKQWCLPNENLLDCEIRLHNPAIMLIRLGTNDADSDRFERYLRQIVEKCIDAGIVPVLGTKADRFEGSDNRINQAIRRVAADYQLPLWDFDAVADYLPGRGLRGDNAHLSAYRANDYTDPQTLAYGYPTSDLTALVVLDALRQIFTAELGQ